MKALKIKFEITKTDDNPYNPEFVQKIQENKEEYKEGKFSSIHNKDELKNFLGLG